MAVAVIALQGCALESQPIVGRTDDGSKLVAVRCAEKKVTEQPCAARAKQACRGTARLHSITSRLEIPITQDSRHIAERTYQYDATYECASR